MTACGVRVACGADLPRACTYGDGEGLQAKRHGSEPTAHSGNGEAYKQI